ncbi:MAG TPA: AIR synthase family protein [Dehalococcoidia bacterium]|nr:AIR synthase family protein [Dehalococcoidia bacterium]
MSDMPEIGKISPEIFTELIYPRLGAKNKNIVIGPQHGVDVGIVVIGDQAVSLTTDPVFIVPEYGWERAAWFALHIIASDSVTSGLKPTYLSIDLSLPMGITREQLSIAWGVIHRECQKYGIAVVTGHTGRYENCSYPMVGGATMLGVGGKDEYVTPQLIREGDALIITKGPAIEACGIFATMFPRYLEKKLGAAFSRRSQDIFYQMSVVEDAMTAVGCGIRDKGVSAMHDATECGIWGGVFEIAQAAGLGVRIEKGKIVVEDCIPEICDLFHIDPYSSISEGTLIIACRPHRADSVINALAANNIKASIVGEFIRQQQGMLLVEDGREKKLQHPLVDPFWRAFYDALQKYNEMEG